MDSCKIILDFEDSTSNNNDQDKDHLLCGNNQTTFETKRNYPNYLSPVPKCLNYISSFSRLVYLRRLRYIKIYMALFVSVIILFMLLSHRGGYSKHESAQEQSLSHLLSNKTVVEKPDLTHIIKDINEIRNNINIRNDNINIDNNYNKINNDNPYSDLNNNSKPSSQPIMVDKSRYSKNATFALYRKDFLKMKINVMQAKIKEAMRHSWTNYRQYAWGYDMLKPRSKKPDHWFNLGLTIVDGADTLIMMGLQEEVTQALEWMENELKFDSRNANSNCFELTIRILAGILTSYHLTGSEKLKEQATTMGDILLHCYDTESKTVPYSDIDLGTHLAHPPTWNPHSSLSEVASIQLEFRYLSQITKDPRYEDITFQTNVLLHNLTATRPIKLLPMYINPTTSRLEESIITLGARADSYYEYLLKQYLQTGIRWLEDDYLDSVDAMGAYLFRHTNGMMNFTYVAEMEYSVDKQNVRYTNKMDHLVCFLPGTLALGYYHFSPLAKDLRLKYNLETPELKLNTRYDSHLKMAQDLARTCYHMYKDMGTGLAPEIANFVHSDDPDNPLATSQPELQVSEQSAHNILRPEFVESLFYLYHITGLPVYRIQGEKVFEAFEKYSRISSGYSPISDVRQKPSSVDDIPELLHKNAPDRMESFWLSETLKYLYLLFCDDRHVIGTLLNHYVFNTEGHIIPIL